MNKFLLTIVSALLLVGCNQVNNTPSKQNTSTYNNEEFNISFQYPSNWEVVDKQVVKKLVDHKVVSEEEKFEHSVVLVTGHSKIYADNPDIFFDYQSESFDEYESITKKAYTPIEIDGEKIGGLSIEEITIANYPAKKYIPYGIEASEIIYIIEKNGKFVKFSTEFYLTEEQKVGIEKILNSLEFE